MLTLHLKSIIFSALQLKSFQPLYTSVENSPRVSLSDRSGIGTGLARQPISLSQASSRGWLKMASPRESQQLAITLTVCLHQSTCVCWPSNMMSLLISCIPLMGSRGEPYPHSRHFLSWCIVEYVHFLLGDQLDFFKVLLLLLMFFSPSFSSPRHSSLPFPPYGVICFALSYLLWLEAAPPCLYPCYVSTCDDFHLFAEVYTELDVTNLLIKPQISWTDTGAVCSDQRISVSFERMVSLCWQAHDKLVASKGKCLKQINASGLHLSVSLSWL